MKECVLSAVNQSYTDLEIIIVDDGSTDSTLSISNRLKELDIRIKIISQPNGGVSAARNSGLNLAKGDWILFCDGDDTLYPDAIQTLVDLAESTGADITSGDYTRKPTTESQTNNQYVFNSEEAILNTLYQKNLEPSACWKLYKASLFDNLRFREGTLYEDLDLFYKLFYKASIIAYTSKVISYYRPVGTSILNTFSAKRLDVLKVTELIDDWARESSNPKLLRAAKDRRLSANFNILGLLAANDALKQNKDTASQCWNIISKYRWQSLINPQVRLKNKGGIILSYLGRNILTKALARHYRKS